MTPLPCSVVGNCAGYGYPDHRLCKGCPLRKVVRREDREHLAEGSKH